MNQLTLAGTLQAGPAQVSDGTFPSGETTIPFALNPPTKGYAVDTGKNVANVNAPSTWQTLAGIGAASTVTQARTLYLRTAVQMTFRITQLLPAGSPTVQTVTVAGLLVVEPAPGYEVTLVEAQGAGTVEFYAAGLL